MRISTSWSHQLTANSLLEQQSKLADSQLKLSSGEKFLTPSEDPIAAVKMVGFNHVIDQNKQYQSNIGAAKQRLALQESSLSDVVQTLHRVRDLTIQGLNDSNSASDRVAIAKELDQLNDHLLDVANTRNANDEYIFSGYKTDVPAFTKTVAVPNTYVYNGDAGQRSIQIGALRQVTDGDDGQAVFGTIGSDNMFETIEQLSNDLKANTPHAASLDKLRVALDKVVTVQSSTGARLNALDDQDRLNASVVLDMKRALSETGDLDYAEAISKFNLQNVSLQAAQQAFVKVQDLSLFKYL